MKLVEQKSDELKLASILLVEDCNADADFFQAFFEGKRICNRVTRVVSYQDAWLHVQSGEKFDLLVVDIRVPGNGGLELVEQIKSFPGYNKVPTIVTSGIETEQDVKKARSLGVVAYIVKPLSQGKWAAAIEELKEIYTGYLVRAG